MRASLLPIVVLLAATASGCKTRTMNETRPSSSTKSNKDMMNVTFLASRAKPFGGKTGVCFYGATTRVQREWLQGGTLSGPEFEELYAAAWKRMSLVKAYGNPASLDKSGRLNLAEISKTPGARKPIETNYVSLEDLDAILGKARGVGPGAAEKSVKVVKKFAGYAVGGTAGAGAALLLSPFAIAGGAIVAAFETVEVVTGNASPKDAVESTAEMTGKMAGFVVNFARATAEVGKDTIEEIPLRTETVALSDLAGITKMRPVQMHIGKYLENLKSQTSDQETRSAEYWMDTEAGTNASVSAGDAAFRSRLALQHLVSLAHENSKEKTEACPDKPGDQ